MKLATKDIEKHAETGSEMDAGEKNAVNICTRTLNRLKIKHFQGTKVVDMMKEIPEIKAEVKVMIVMIFITEVEVMSLDAPEAEVILKN